jgi:hypothetical protein
MTAAPEMLISFGKYLVGFQLCIFYAVASVVYHWGDLKPTEDRLIAAEDRFWSYRAITKLNTFFENNEVVGGVGTCVYTNMKATGIPPYIYSNKLGQENSEKLDRILSILQVEEEGDNIRLVATNCMLERKVEELTRK